MSSETPNSSALTLTISASAPLPGPFLGFGFEWDSCSYAKSGVTDADFAVIRNRIHWMRPSLVRIMILAKWCYKGDGQFDWDSPDMRNLYRHLDVCEELGATVLLTDWGIESEWLNIPDAAKVDDPLYARIIGQYLEHLLNTRKYTCIRYVIMGNEPNHEVRVWERWKQGFQQLHQELHARGLLDRLALAGPDNTGDDEWLTNAAEQLAPMIGAYDIHCYAGISWAEAEYLGRHFTIRRDWVRERDPDGCNKPFLVGEAGFQCEGFGAAGNPMNADTQYATLMADYAVQATNGGASAVLAWMLDDNSHEGFNWGMWHNCANGLACKPWFYSWALLTRFFPSGAEMLPLQTSAPGIRAMACRIPVRSVNGPSHDWSLCIVNPGETAQSVRIRIQPSPGSISFQRYDCIDGKGPTDADGLPRCTSSYSLTHASEDPITCAPFSVTLLTTRT